MMRKACFAAQRRAAHRTPLYDFHKEVGCKFVDFAGWEMPVQYNGWGLVKEHKAVRESSGLFDVSHMGQWVIEGADRERFLEWVTPIDFSRLEYGTGALSVITNEQGGIIDDTVIVRGKDAVAMVVNAGCQEKDYVHIQAKMKEFNGDVRVVRLEKSLVALQGPEAAMQLSKLGDIGALPFMGQKEMVILGEKMVVTRCGYTGEDGFEISCSNGKAAELCNAFREGGVAMAGLGARDTLRLEAGLCLYGSDMNEETSPIEASLGWLISDRRKEGGDFIGAEKILTHIKAKPNEPGAYKQKRVSILVHEGAPARHDAKILNEALEEVGYVTSGTFAPSTGQKIAMGYVNRNLQKIGTKLRVEVRGKVSPAEVVRAPFVPHRYYRGA